MEPFKEKYSTILLELPMLYTLTFSLLPTAKEWKRLVFATYSVNE